MFSAYTRAKQVRKEYLYESYSILIDEPKEYEKISRTKMIDEMLKFYLENKEVMFELFSDKELDFLFSLNTNEKYQIRNENFKALHFFLLLSWDDNLNYYSISEELKDLIDDLKIIYNDNKEEIEKTKETSYLFVGIVRAYGAITMNELKCINKKVNKEINLYLTKYTSRFVGMDELSSPEIIALSNIIELGKDIVRSHPKTIRVKWSYDQFVSIGKNYFMTSNPEYISMYSYPKLIDFINSVDKEDFLIWRGLGLTTGWFDYNLENFLKSITDDEKACFFTFLDHLPSYILEKNDKNILSEEDGELFYEIIIPFLEYASLYYDLEFKHYNKSYNPYQTHAIFEQCFKDDFKIVNNYISDTKNLPQKHKDILLGFKNYKNGTLILVKHTKDGSIFADANNHYLVKGIQTPFESMEFLKQTPCVCLTTLLPFKDNITYTGIIVPYASIGPTMKKEVLQNYKNKKDNVIKKL